MIQMTVDWINAGVHNYMLHGKPKNLKSGKNLTKHVTYSFALHFFRQVNIL